MYVCIYIYIYMYSIYTNICILSLYIYIGAAFGCVRKSAFANADGKVRSCVRATFGVRTEFMLRSGRVRERAFGNARSLYKSTGRVRDPTKIYRYIISPVAGVYKPVIT